ncbi:CBS domain-containing protein CBSX3, mitochondrial-like isoform X1 [Cucurbita pepo subsp. pepo]|uniref:CBS domain-containing protein CBSX3, mitochondrial-like isoform X1 n=1 Tax=Cucurbita pepo subsp. pepo TaxID=3664 RepID=UPI000C9D8538|nr:CBS domain-containing protein CBSX3, mitochondrial-like isoform X1 [Cucurbita pepo subsp. pepo]
MQAIVRALRSWQETLKIANSQHSCRRETNQVEKILEGSESRGSSSPLKGLENITVAEIVSRNGDGSIGSSWLSCSADDAAIDTVQNVASLIRFRHFQKARKLFLLRRLRKFSLLQMARNNVGSLVVLKPEGQQIAGIVTEGDYLKKIIADGRCPIYTKVGEIMTCEDKLVTVTSDTNILKAMQLMTENRIRHVPVIDGKLVGMISVVDVVKAVVKQQNGELERLNEYIKGESY